MYNSKPFELLETFFFYKSQKTNMVSVPFYIFILLRHTVFFSKERTLRLFWCLEIQGFKEGKIVSIGQNRAA